jgi:hypothetical protein
LPHKNSTHMIYDHIASVRTAPQNLMIAQALNIKRNKTN